MNNKINPKVIKKRVDAIKAAARQMAEGVSIVEISDDIKREWCAIKGSKTTYGELYEVITKAISDCNSYFDLFPTLVSRLGEEKLNGKKNLIFCEAKVSLMVERYICALRGGSFNTEVYSFGKYLSAKKKIDKLLSKEGSSMAVKRILTYTPLTRFNKSRASLAPTMYDLIIQLKSAKISPDDISRASESVSGVLKNKLVDISAVYGEYEKFIKEGYFVVGQYNSDSDSINALKKELVIYRICQKL